MGQRLYRKRDPRDPTRFLPNWYTTIDGRAVSTGCRDRRAAEARSAQLERAAYAPRDATPDAPTLAEALARAVVDRQQRGRAEGTLAMWEVKAGHLLRIFGRETRLSAFAPPAGARLVDDYQAQRHEEGAKEPTVAKELGCLSVTLRIAYRRGEVTFDPRAVMPVELHRESKPRTRALSPDEARRLLADLEDDTLPDRHKARSMRNRAACVAFIIGTSARWGEAERARREDVLLLDGGGFVTLRGTKTAGAARVVPILPTTAPLLRIALKHGGDGLLFEPWGNVRRDLHAACARLGIAPVSPNDLRRTTAQWLRSAGVEPHLIAAVLGHADARMVERVYGKITPEALGEALRARVGGVVPLLPVGTKRGKKARTG